ncbi:hypothetical protein [Bacillus thermotolerans]|uniref:S-layer domain protein n=1 Tax=Bacillus thermotolerans TaxID=1221996 RepID=A0A0F5I6N0_BACTR|nr:hypothetical protein [Bacillus thermotolerans]KKB40950.1 S-layer domain protein [Bacillus thermotolerans]
MLKQASSLLMFILLLGLADVNEAQTKSLIQGTFMSAGYEEVLLDDGTTGKRMTNITIMNDRDQTMTVTMDPAAKLTIDGRSVNIDAFKQGMPIEADVQLRRVKALRGQSVEFPGAIEDGDRTVTGTINDIAADGTSLSIRLDDGRIQTYFLHSDTTVSKGSTLADVSVMYEGDRAQLTFCTYDTNYIDSIKVQVQGIKVENLYKGTIQRIDPVRNKLMIKNEQVFRNWEWQPSLSPVHTSYTFSTKTPIYIGDQPVKRNWIYFFVNRDVYFVTVSQFGQEVIQQMVIGKNLERTFYEPMTFVNPSAKQLGLIDSGSVRYHDGTILIRNGRLVDSYSLQQAGTAFVVTDGKTKSEYANVIHVTNDGFQSPNLANHTLYYGKIQRVNGYQLLLTDASELSNNYWKKTSKPVLSFSNDTKAVEDEDPGVLRVEPRDEMESHTNEYGYFYVADGHIVAAHLIDSSNQAQIVSVGRLDMIDAKKGKISVRNVSHWQQGAWKEHGMITSMDIQQATIIRDNRVITIEDLQLGERLYMLHDSPVQGRILLVN